MVSKDSKWRNAEQFSRQVRPSEVLISLPPEEAITRLFQKGFARNGLNFAAGVEIPSLDSMKAYVASGFGVGLALAIPGSSCEPAVGILPIAKFPGLFLARSGPANYWRSLKRFPTRSDARPRL